MYDICVHTYVMQAILIYKLFRRMLDLSSTLRRIIFLQCCLCVRHIFVGGKLV